MREQRKMAKHSPILPSASHDLNPKIQSKAVPNKDVVLFFFFFFFLKNTSFGCPAVVPGLTLAASSGAQVALCG